ncbi:heavy-metal-associated domain-containing protein [Streptomyces hainanensis]|uniref:Heavy-metal-associated domain-containing protein n=1 Tax=Streptomyces hainanensis TaxID=402648 RepID=A0A4R4T2Q1_9ACTN|nr:cation transporter [Streptomyces hainanensis]TDC68723.1 heavy-metal-associated domain-containing protein [Streptomyces hainanensis]
MTAPTAQTVSTYTVSGMTCAHCVGSVSAEVGRIPGVSGVEVVLETGRVTVASEGPVDNAAVSAAVEEAGYEVVAGPEGEAPAASCCGGGCH